MTPGFTSRLSRRPMWRRRRARLVVARSFQDFAFWRRAMSIALRNIAWHFPIGVDPYLQQFAAKRIQFRLVVVLFGLGERVFSLRH